MELRKDVILWHTWFVLGQAPRMHVCALPCCQTSPKQSECPHETITKEIHHLVRLLNSISPCGMGVGMHSFETIVEEMNTRGFNQPVGA